MKRQADLLTGIRCMISQGKVVVISCRIQIRERDDGTVKAPWDVHQAATWSLCRYKRTDPASTHCAKGACHRARLISVWPSDFQNTVWRFSSHECAGVDPKTPNAHQRTTLASIHSTTTPSWLTRRVCVQWGTVWKWSVRGGATGVGVFCTSVICSWKLLMM